MQKKYKCFLFDLDGTLLDTAPEFLISLNSLLKKNKMHLVSDSFVRIRVSDGVGRLVQDSFKINEDHSEFENLRNKLLDEYHKNFLLSKTFSGVDQILNKLTINKIDWMIVTNKPKRFSHEICKKFMWDKYAKAIISPDDVKGKRKPDPATLNAALSKTSISKKESVYVGDNWRDLEAAENAKITPIFAEYGYVKAENYPLNKRGFNIKNIREILSFI